MDLGDQHGGMGPLGFDLGTRGSWWITLEHQGMRPLVAHRCDEI